MSTSKSKLILLGEDDEFLASVFIMSLQKEGYEMVHAPDGEEVLKKLEEITPDLMLLDLMMPKKNGFEVLEEMSKNPKWKKIRVTVLSNLGQASDEKEARRLGAKDYFVKTSIGVAEIVKHVNGVFKK